MDNTNNSFTLTADFIMALINLLSESESDRLSELTRRRREKEIEYNELVRKYPQKIPVKEIAKFLEMKEENVRIAVVQKTLEGSLHTESENGVKAFYILPVPFGNWYFKERYRGV